jgi:16S rRNA (cytosine1402-N4)-methyltransferase
MPEFCHVPVLLSEVLRFLDPKPGESFIDGTVGLGGHAKELVARVLPGGRLLAIDRDQDNLERAKKRLAEYIHRVVFVRDSFVHLADHAYAHGFSDTRGVLLDLGFSSVHVDDPSRGFSFQTDGPLDMRYDQTQELTAAIIVNEWTKEELVRIFRVYGEERFAMKMADAIIKARKKERILRTVELVDVVTSVAKRRGRIHPATRVFQALRIAVNDELGELERALPEALKVLAPGGRLAIISFHSLEDRAVKRFFKQHDGRELTVLTKHVVTPTEDECKRNPRARSAKLRVVEKR